MVDHRLAQMSFRPFDRIGVGALAGQEQRAEFRQIVLRDELRVGILLADRAEGSRRGEQGDDAMLGNDAPKSAGVRRADRLAFEQHRRATMQQRRIDDVGVADHPADIGSRPERLARFDAEFVLHRPFEHDHVAAVVAHNAFWLAGRSGCVKNIERVRSLYRHAIDIGACGAFARHLIREIEVAAFDEFARLLRPLQDQAALDLMRGDSDGAVQQRLVRHDPPRLEAAGRGDDDFRLGVVDAGRQFPRRKAAEHDGMNRPQPCAGEHRKNRFGHHRHIDDDAIAFADALVLQHRRQRHDLLFEFEIGEFLLRAGDGAVVDQRNLVGAVDGDMAVNAIPARIARRSDEPAAIDAGVRRRRPCPTA